MEEKNVERKLDSSPFNKAIARCVINIYKLKDELKKIDDDYSRQIAELTNTVKAFYEQQGLSEYEEFSFVTNEDSIFTKAINRLKKKVIFKFTSRMTVTFDADKLEAKLDKKYKQQIIDKKIEIYDVEGFIAYLKELKADPKIFKSFISISKTVNKEELERLEGIGKIDSETIEGCYQIQTTKPSLKITVKDV